MANRGIDQILSLRGARTHGIGGPEGINLELDLRKITVITGVSGSGKSSLAVDTLAAESRRRQLEALQDGGLGCLPRPPFELIEGLPPVFLIGPDRVPPRATTLGAYLGISNLLAGIFAKEGVVHCPESGVPLPCWNREAVVDDLLKEEVGTPLTLMAPIPTPTPEGAPAALEELRRQGWSRLRIAGQLRSLDDVERLPTKGEIAIVLDRVKVAPERRDRLNEAVETAWSASGGLLEVAIGPSGNPKHYARTPWSNALQRMFPAPSVANLDPTTGGRCPNCRPPQPSNPDCEICAGTGLRESPRLTRVAQQSLEAWWTGPTLDLQRLCTLNSHPVLRILLNHLSGIVDHLIQLGLAHLPASRPLVDLSAGEWARLQLVGLLSQGTRGTLLILDELGSRLDPQSTELVIGSVQRAFEGGCAVIWVDHNVTIRESADWEVGMGPGAGRDGGRIVYQGVPRTAVYELPLPHPYTPRSQWVCSAINIKNLRNLEISLNAGAWTTVQGPSGSGKTALIRGALLPMLRSRPPECSGPPVELILADHQRPSGGLRSNLATVLGLWTSIRDCLTATQEAKLRGWDASRFSFNRPGGRCEVCQGTGLEVFETPGLAPLSGPCPVCEGRRFNRETLQVRWKGHNAAELLELDVQGALSVFTNLPRLQIPLRSLVDVGLGYLRLGQPTDTLSGGEAQRLLLGRAIAEISGRKPHVEQLLMMDNPSAGLHEHDIGRLVAALQELHRRGVSILIADNHPSFAAAANHVLKLGPGPGPQGGTWIP